MLNMASDGVFLVVSIDQCVWNVVMNDPKSTTREDAIRYDNKSLKQCMTCYNTNPQVCQNYRVHSLIERYSE